MMVSLDLEEEDIKDMIFSYSRNVIKSYGYMKKKDYNLTLIDGKTGEEITGKIVIKINKIEKPKKSSGKIVLTTPPCKNSGEI